MTVKNDDMRETSANGEALTRRICVVSSNFQTVLRHFDIVKLFVNSALEVKTFIVSPKQNMPNMSKPQTRHGKMPLSDSPSSASADASSGRSTSMVQNGDGQGYNKNKSKRHFLNPSAKLMYWSINSTKTIKSQMDE